MRQLAICLGLILGVGCGSTTSADAGLWTVRSHLEGQVQPCENAAIELTLRSTGGEALGSHRLVFSDYFHDEVWPAPGAPGETTVELHRFDCGGIRAKVAELATVVTSTTQRKQIYVAAVVHDTAIDPRFFEIDTYSNANGRMSAHRDGSTLVLKNLGSEPVRLCGHPRIQSLRDEYLVDEEWQPAEEQNWTVPDEELVIQPGATLTIDPKVTIHRYVPPNAGTPTIPDAARVMVAIEPESVNQVVLGDVPRAFLGFARCDVLYVPRRLSEQDKIWPREDKR